MICLAIFDLGESQRRQVAIRLRGTMVVEAAKDVNADADANADAFAFVGEDLHAENDFLRTVALGRFVLVAAGAAVWEPVLRGRLDASRAAKQVRGLVGAVKPWPLQGGRLLDPLRDSTTLEPKLVESHEQRNGDTNLVIHIKGVPTIENLPEYGSEPEWQTVSIGRTTCRADGAPRSSPIRHRLTERHARSCRSLASRVSVRRSVSGWTRSVSGWAGSRTSSVRRGGHLAMPGVDVSLLSRVLQSEIAQLRQPLDA